MAHEDLKQEARREKGRARQEGRRAVEIAREQRAEMVKLQVEINIE
jgi:hypothetical protein